MLLNGKKALVTGSSQGIGLAVAKSLVRHGAKVVITSESKSAPNEIDLPFISADLSVEGEAERLVESAWQMLGGFDILVNNVGTFREPEFGQLTKKNFDSTFNLNVWSAIACTQKFVELARKAGQFGRILFSSSLNGTRSEPGHTLYDASKGAINALTRQLAIELAPFGFTTAAVAPGLIATPLTDFGLQSDPAARQSILNQIPLGKIATAEEISEWYAFLASDGAAYATGIVVPVCGGLDAQQMPSRPLSDKKFD